jgi:hypothetical protein
MPLLNRLVFVAPLLLVACGGVALEHDTDGGAPYGGGGTSGSGAAANGGSVPGGGKGGSGGSVNPGHPTPGPMHGAGGYLSPPPTGAGGYVSPPPFPGTGGTTFPGTGGCCLALPYCSPGERQIDSPQGCAPEDVGCRPVSACCSTIWCHKVPTIVDGGGPVDAAPDARTCSDPPPKGVHYLGMGNCAAIDYICPKGVSYYKDACGCGCRQDVTCPDYIDCEPTGSSVPRDPRCSDQSVCPYTIRAF